MLTHECKGNASYKHLSIKQENIDLYYKNKPRIFATVPGLLGTVIGMIRSFAALSAGGGADSMALSQGISEALINTAFGILTGALAVISYNYFTNKIDKLTYGLDEVGFSIVQTFAATH